MHQVAGVDRIELLFEPAWSVVVDGELLQQATGVGHAVRRVRGTVPLNAVGQHAVAEQSAIIGQGDLPVEIVAAERGRNTDIEAGLFGQLLEVGGIHHPGDQLRLLPDRGAHARAVEAKPARMARRLAVRIDGDDFEIGVVTELHQVVMSSHTLVFAARRDFNAKRFANIVHALLQVLCCDDDVIEAIHRAMLDHNATC